MLNNKADSLELSDDLQQKFEYLVDKGQQLLRIDKFLIDRVEAISRTKIQEAAKVGLLTVNDSTVKPSYKVKPFDKVTLVLPFEKREIELTAENIPLNLVFEDDHLLVLNKPAGLVVHPGFGNFSGTLVNALVYHFNKLGDSGDATRPGLVHRLDKNTTGLMVVAKTDSVLHHLSKQFFKRTTDRKYIALAWGDVKEDSGSIEGYIGRDLRNRKVMRVFDSEESGKYAKTNFKVLKRFGYTTLVECKLETGRTHQIRAHFKHIGHPLFGDFEYGGDKILKGTTFSKYKQFITNCFTILPRQALHAVNLGFDHPVNGERLFFNSELPEDMATVISKMESYTNS